jgi:hypothetical protein
MPDGYTVLPMRDITTTRTIAIFMGGRANRNFAVSQSHLCLPYCLWRRLSNIRRCRYRHAVQTLAAGSSDACIVSNL